MACDPKEVAARGALSILSELEESIRVMGVGTGSTVDRFISLLAGSEISDGIEGYVPTSIDTGLKLYSRGLRRVLDSIPVSDKIDVYVDGADEVDPSGNLIKGRGGALLGEKIVAYSSRLNIIIVDESKLVEMLGEKKPVPVEVVPRALGYVYRVLESMGLNPRHRSCSCKDGPAVSDNGGVLLDLYTGPIEDPRRLDVELHMIPGIVETGLFLGLTDIVVVGSRDCSWRVLRFDRGRR